MSKQIYEETIMSVIKKDLLKAAAVSLLLISPASAGELLVYSSTDADNLKYYMDEFQKDYPDIKVNVVRESTGTMAAKMMAEKDNPQADVLFEMAATVALNMEEAGMFHPYTPKGMDEIDQRYVDKEGEVNWVGNYGWAGCICWNTVEAEKLGLPKPTKWSDLTNPVYKGLISMPNPNSSGTGFLDVSSWIQIMGEEAAWEYMDKLHSNVAVYTHSGSKPCKQAGAGEFPIGISWPGRAIKIIKAGAPMEMIIPEINKLLPDDNEASEQMPSDEYIFDDDEYTPVPHNQIEMVSLPKDPISQTIYALVQICCMANPERKGFTSSLLYFILRWLAMQQICTNAYIV